MGKPNNANLQSPTSLREFTFEAMTVHKGISFSSTHVTSFSTHVVVEKKKLIPCEQGRANGDYRQWKCSYVSVYQMCVCVWVCGGVQVCVLCTECVCQVCAVYVCESVWPLDHNKKGMCSLILLI